MFPRQDQQDGSYDPYADRAPPKPLSDFKSLANLVKSALGTGLFVMPNAFASVGLVIGIVGTMLIGLLITISLHMLLEIHHKMCVVVRRPILHYDQVVVASIVTTAQKSWLSDRVVTYIIDITILTCYIGIGAVYVVFIGGVVQHCLDSDKTIDQAYYSLMLFPLFFVINMMRYLSDLAIVSIIGNVLLLIATAIGMIYAVKDGIGSDWVAVAEDVALYPKFIGTAFFSMTSPGLVLAIEHDMKNPENYKKKCGILTQGMMCITLLHVFVGVIGYLKWGDKSMGNFLRNHPDNDVPTLAAFVMQTLTIYFTYGLQCYMPIYILYHDYILPAYENRSWKGTPYIYDVGVRFVISLVTCLLAALVPKVDLFIGLVGAACTSLLATLIPVSLYLLVNCNDFGKYKWKLLLGTVMLTVGLFITMCAIVVDIGLIVAYYKEKYFRSLY